MTRGTPAAGRSEMRMCEGARESSTVKYVSSKLVPRRYGRMAGKIRGGGDEMSRRPGRQAGVWTD